MKKYIIILIAAVLFAGCGGKKQSLKVEDPAERAALRTRDASCPIDSIFTSDGAATAFQVFSKVRPKAFLKDFREAESALTDVKPSDRFKEAYASVKKDHAEEYNPGLTIYCTVIVLFFVVLVLFKVIRAIFKND